MLKQQQKKKKSPKKKQANPKPKVKDSVVINAPVAKTKVKRTPRPQVTRNSRNGDVEVTHREFIADIPGSVLFSSIQFAVNPGLASSFPWLSQMAPLYESYRFESLKFEFQTMSSTTTTGTVMAAIDYDASDPAPVDKQQLASYRGFVRSAPWSDFSQVSLNEDLNKRKSYFVRVGTLSANQDIKLYDIGNLFLAVQGQVDTSVVGELYVHYRVKLMTPQLGNPAVGSSLSARFYANTAATVPALVSGSNAPLVCTGTANSGVITLTATGPYAGLLTINGATTVAASAPTTTGSTATVQSAIFAAQANSFIWNAQVYFQSGQTLVFNLTEATWTATGLQIGQFNALVL